MYESFAVRVPWFHVWVDRRSCAVYCLMWLHRIVRGLYRSSFCVLSRRSNYLSVFWYRKERKEKKNSHLQFWKKKRKETKNKYRKSESSFNVLTAPGVATACNWRRCWVELLLDLGVADAQARTGSFDLLLREHSMCVRHAACVALGYRSSPTCEQRDQHVFLY